jgi:hypothetical protein
MNRPKLLLNISYISITHDLCNDWLYIDWKGHLDGPLVRAGCEQILICLHSTSCKKILNDNSSVTGDWECASQWLGQEFLPNLAEAGLHYLAWVYSPNYLSRRAIDTALSFVTTPTVVSFEDVDAAYSWLQRKRHTLDFKSLKR